MLNQLSNAHKTIHLLVIVNIVIGVSIIVCTEYYHMTLRRYLFDIERRTLRLQFFYADLLGLEVVLIYICGFAIWRRSLEFSRHLWMVLLIWNCGCVLVLFHSVGTAMCMYGSVEGFENSAENSLFRGIDLYVNDPEWRLLWDDLQLHQQCCGVEGYSDWMYANWVGAMGGGGEEEDEETQQPPPCDLDQFALVPFSCCKRCVLKCYESSSPLPTGKLPALNISTINKAGCLPLFSNGIWHFIHFLLTIVSVAFFIQIVIAILCRLFFLYKKECACASGGHGCDDECGRPVVIVKCPRDVKCILTSDDDNCDNLSNTSNLEFFEEEDAQQPSLFKPKPFCKTKRISFSGEHEGKTVHCKCDCQACSNFLH